MVRDIYRRDPDGELDFDGYEEDEEDNTEWEMFNQSYFW
jgi:hypothetical protein